MAAGAPRGPGATIPDVAPQHLARCADFDRTCNRRVCRDRIGRDSTRTGLVSGSKSIGQVVLCHHQLATTHRHRGDDSRVQASYRPDIPPPVSRLLTPAVLLAAGNPGEIEPGQGQRFITELLTALKKTKNVAVLQYRQIAISCRSFMDES